MTDPGKTSLAEQVAQLGQEVGARAGDLLRLRSQSPIASRAEGDARFMKWLSDEAKAEVRDAIVEDPWTSADVHVLARRIRTAALIQRTGVARIPGLPVQVTLSEAAERSGAQTRERDRPTAPWVQLATAAGAARAIWDEECDRWVDLPRGLPRGKYVALNVKGESMLPLLHDGDVVLVDMAAQPRLDDVVLARIDDGYVVKRLAENSPAGIVLESLNAGFEPIAIRDPERAVAGVVVLRWCDHAGDGRAASAAAPPGHALSTALANTGERTTSTIPLEPRKC